MNNCKKGLIKLNDYLNLSETKKLLTSYTRNDILIEDISEFRYIIENIAKLDKKIRYKVVEETPTSITYLFKRNDLKLFRSINGDTNVYKTKSDMRYITATKNKESLMRVKTTNYIDDIGEEPDRLEIEIGKLGDIIYDIPYKLSTENERLSDYTYKAILLMNELELAF